MKPLRALVRTISLCVLLPVFLALPAQAQPLLDTAHFAPPAEIFIPENDFSGTLYIDATPAEWFEVFVDSFDLHPARAALSSIPALSVDLVQHRNIIAPIQSGPIAANHPDWEWIVQPGAIWREEEHTVISLPVALMERNANCVHNGLLRIDLENDGAIASTLMQIASETCAYFQFDMRVEPTAQFVRGRAAGSEETIASYLRERAERIPQMPLSTLPIAAALPPEGEVSVASLTNSGLVLDGIHYVSDCPTRAGLYPFCDELVLPSYSWAKSIIAGIAAMRLEQIYPAALQNEVADLVPSCATEDWRAVTMADALGMVTGVYNSRDHEVDENSFAMQQFFLRDSHIEKITIACQAFNRRADPGERFVYRTGDTYIFGTALTSFLRRQQRDPQADYYWQLLQPIWDRLRLSPLMENPRRTYDEVQQPFTGWGLVMTRNDLARIAQFLQDGGSLNGEQLLNPAMLSSALQRMHEPQGPKAGRSDQRYSNGFWAWNAGPPLGCEGDLWIPTMSGYGGLTAALMPSGATYYFVSDGGAFRWRQAAAAINTIQQQCEAAP